MTEILLSSLRIEDLRRVPVWELDVRFEQMEIWEKTPYVRSTHFTAITLNGRDDFICLTEFTLEDGAVAFGFCEPPEETYLCYCPTIIVEDDHVPLYCETRTWDERRNCRILGRNTKQIFPVGLVCRVTCDGQVYREILQQPEWSQSLTQTFNFTDQDSGVQGTFHLHGDRNELEVWGNIEDRVLSTVSRQRGDLNFFLRVKAARWNFVAETIRSPDKPVPLVVSRLSGLCSTEQLITPREAREIVTRCVEELRHSSHH